MVSILHFWLDTFHSTVNGMRDERDAKELGRIEAEVGHGGWLAFSFGPQRLEPGGFARM